MVKTTQNLCSFLLICLSLSCKVFFTKSRGGPVNEVWVTRLKGQSTSPSCLVRAPRAMGWVWWCYGIIFIELQHEDTLPVLPWIIQPPSALLEDAVFFLGTLRKRELLFLKEKEIKRSLPFFIWRVTSDVRSAASGSSSVSCLNSWQSCLLPH